MITVNLTPCGRDMARRNSLQEKIENRIAKSGDAAFLTREFKDLGGDRQIVRALKKSVRDGKLIRIGYGTYVKAKTSSITAQPIPAGDFVTITRRVLDKLNIAWEPSTAEKDYNAGRSTQVPANGRVRLLGRRFSRKLRYKRMELGFEKKTR